MVAIIKPKHILIYPFITDFSDNAETNDNPNKTSAHCSTAPNLRAKSESSGEIKKRMTRPINAPNVLDIIASPSAKSPLPL